MKHCFFLLYQLSKSAIVYVSHGIFPPNQKKVHNRFRDCSFFIVEFSIFHSCLCFHVFTVNKYDNYLHNGLMSHSNNLGNIKVRVTFTARKAPLTKYLTVKIIQINFFPFFLRGEGDLPVLRTPSRTLMIITIIQCFTNLVFNSKNLVTLKGQPLKVQFFELQYS